MCMCVGCFASTCRAVKASVSSKIPSGFVRGVSTNILCAQLSKAGSPVSSNDDVRAATYASEHDGKRAVSRDAWVAAGRAAVANRGGRPGPASSRAAFSRMLRSGRRRTRRPAALPTSTTPSEPIFNHTKPSQTWSSTTSSPPSARSAPTTYVNPLDDRPFPRPHLETRGNMEREWDTCEYYQGTTADMLRKTARHGCSRHHVRWCLPPVRRQQEGRSAGPSHQRLQQGRGGLHPVRTWNHAGYCATSVLQYRPFVHHRLTDCEGNS